MSDIVERLRNFGKVYPEEQGNLPGSLFLKAATEIERLRGVLKEIAECDIDTFTINPEGRQAISVEGITRFASEDDVVRLTVLAMNALHPTPIQKEEK